MLLIFHFQGRSQAEVLLGSQGDLNTW